MQLEAAEQKAEEAIAKVAEMRNARPELVASSATKVPPVASSFQISNVPFGGLSMPAPMAVPEGPPVTPAVSSTVPKVSSVGGTTWEVKATPVPGSGPSASISDHGNGFGTGPLPASPSVNGQAPACGNAGTPTLGACAAQRCPGSASWSASMHASPSMGSPGAFPPGAPGPGAPSQPALLTPAGGLSAPARAGLPGNLQGSFHADPRSAPGSQQQPQPQVAGPGVPGTHSLAGRSAPASAVSTAALSARALSAAPPGMGAMSGAMPYPAGASRPGQPGPVQRLQSAPQPSSLNSLS